MSVSTFFFLCVLLILLMTGSVKTVRYSRQWAVKILGGPEVADAIASKYGFINLGEILDDYYHFQHNSVAKRSATPSDEHHGNLLSEQQVKWAQQQVVRSRKKRDFIPIRTRSYSFKSSSKENMVNLNDIRWPQMWYLNRGNGLDMNVQPVWKEGIIGRGVVVSILDDGLEKNHPDLVRNYDPQASYDVNSHDEDPMPRYDFIDSNRHGTRCAGEVAATANNSLCAVGVAFGASVGGVRMLDGDVTDAVEARSLSLNPQHIDIYSASWGPDDDGKTVDGPGELATRAFIEGVTRGRSGKGSIFVWASGNGGRDHDNCNCDGYTNSIWTLSISSATEDGMVPWYSEACSSTLATTYSSGSPGQKQIVTTDLRQQCTSGHTGTSASAPLAAGICALALESNRDLSWRDMQHIVVRTAKPANLNSPDWKVNGVGRNVSHSFGYGLMDAAAMVQLARTWKSVPDQHKCEVSAPQVDKLIPAKSQVVLQLNVKDCAGVNYLEHVQAKITLASARRGDLQIHLISPAGTRSTLLARRPHDSSRAGFQNWPFMSVHNWGEKPFGMWQLEIHNEGRFLGTLSQWKLIIHGTDTHPNSDVDFVSHVGDLKNVINNGKMYSPDNPVNNNIEPYSGEDWRRIQLSMPGSEHAGSEVQRATTEEGNKPATSGCITVSKNGQDCIECVEGQLLYDGQCYIMCPETTFNDTTSGSQTVCERCHYSCRLCSGPNDYQCESCFADAWLQQESKDEKYCYPLSLKSKVDYTKWSSRMFLGFIVNIAVIVAILFTCFICRIVKRHENSYMRVINENEHEKMIRPTTKTDNVIYPHSGSESEGD